MRFIDIYAYVMSTGVLLHDTSDLLWIICTYLCLNISSKRPSKHDTIEPMSAECRGISAMTYRCRTDVMSLMLVICIIIILLCFDNTRRLSMFTLLLFQLLFVNIKSSYRGESNGSTHLYIRPETPAWNTLRSNPSLHTLSKALDRS